MSHPGVPSASARPPAPDAVRRVWLCIRVAALVSAALVAWLTVVTLAGDGLAADRHGVTYAQAVRLYAGGGLAAGLVAGVLLPLGRTASGAALVGALGALPFCLGYGWATQGPPAATWDWLAVPLIGAGTLGGGVGVFVWRGLQRMHASGEQAVGASPRV